MYECSEWPIVAIACYRELKLVLLTTHKMQPVNGSRELLKNLGKGLWH